MELSRQLLPILGCFVFLVATHIQGNGAEVTAEDKLFFPFRTVFKNEFQAEAEVYLQISKEETSVVYYDAFYDLENTMGRLDYYMNKATTSAYYNANIEQTAVIAGDKCTVYKENKEKFLSSSPFYWGFISTDNSPSPVFGPGALLFRKTTEPPKYESEEIVRGINCVKFTATDTTDQVTISYWLSLESWNNPGKIRVPVKVSALGTTKENVSVNLTVHFSSFYADVKNRQDFMIPTGIGCEGYKTITPPTLPKTPLQYSFELEIFDNDADEKTGLKDIVLYKVWYNNLGKAMKVIGTKDGLPFQEVQDYQRGVMYSFNEMDVCSIGPLRNSKAELLVSRLLRSMTSEEALIHMDEKYYFVGQKEERGLNCDVWEAVHYNGTFGDAPWEKVVYTYYFSTDQEEMVSGDGTNSKVPVALRVMAYEMVGAIEPMTFQFNYFRFDKPIGRDFFDLMKIDSCFQSGTEKNLFTITFEGTEEEVLEAKRNHLETKVGAELVVVASAAISGMRLSMLEVFYETKRVLVQGEILDLPKDIASFYMSRDVSLNPFSENPRSGDIQSENDCARTCLTDTNVCSAFTYCPNEKTCYTTDANGASEWPKTEATSKSCKVYLKSILRAQSKEPSLSGAIRNLQMAVSSGQMQIELNEATGTGQKVVLKAKDFDASFQPIDGGSTEYEVVQTEKQLVSSSSSSLEVNMDLQTPLECYLQCLQETSLSCSSFSYCSRTNKCRLSSVYVSKENREDVEAATNCQVYRKGALKFFEQKEGVFSRLKTSSMTVKDSVECANICRNKDKKDDYCRGFLHCPKQNTCYPSKTHGLDNNALDTNSERECNYYHLLYSPEFVNSGRLAVKDEKNLIEMIATFETCAKDCFENSDCRSINYCTPVGDEKPFCQLTTKTVFDKDAEYLDRDDCKNYYKKNAMDPVSPTEKPIDESEKIFIPFSWEIGSNFQLNVTFYENSAQKTHLTAVEYQDLVNKRGRIEMQTGKKSSTFLYYTDPRQVVSISDAGRCSVDLDKNSEFFTKYIYWGWSSPDSEVKGPSAILFRNTTDLPVWKSRTIERGILCDEFYAFDKENPEVQLSYYVTVPFWNNPTKVNMRAPIRIRAVGGNINSSWDFMHFQADLHNSKVFQIPTGIGCLNFRSKETFQLPELSPLYSFVAEYGDLTDATLTNDLKIINWRIWYDSQKRIMKIRGTEKDQPYSEIQDFNTGVAYHVNNMGECRIASIQDSFSEKEERELVFVLKDPRQLLNLDGNFYYVGTDIVRDVEVDVWEGFLYNHFFGRIRFEQTVVTAYFSQNKTEVVSEGKQNAQVPVMMRIVPLFPGPATKAGTFELNFFDFDETLDNDFYSEMNVEACFPEETQRDLFRLSIPVNTTWYETAIKQAKMFESSIRWAVINAAMISSLRLPVLKIYFEPEMITAEGVMLERAPVINGFLVPENKNFTPNIGTEPKTVEKSEDDCAVKCIDQMNNNCTGFTTCPAGNNGYDCYLTSKYDLNGWPAEVKGNGCKFYGKAINSETTRDVPLNLAIGILKEKVEKKEFKITFLDSKEIDLISYIPEKIETGLGIGRPSSFEGFLKVMDGRQFVKGAETSLTVKDKVSSSAECSKRCQEETNIPCSSFSFCPNSYECTLSTMYVRTGNEQGTEATTSCAIYHKNAISFFDEMKGKTSRAEGAKSMNKASPEECALACKEETGFDCRGFDYCRMDKTCTLSTVHQIDLPALSDSSSCTHYSRKYSLDFDIKGRQLVWAEGRSFTIEAASVDVCAKLCVDYYQDKGVACKSFNFCLKQGRLSSECQINMDSFGDPGVKVTPGIDCLYYESKPQSAQVEETLVDQVSNKSFDALLACMFFLGIALGVGGFMGYSYYRKKKDGGDGVTIRYTKESS